jgi:glycosyltransferase involved in cell wall biosynthesis
VQRWMYFAKYLKQFGLEVTVICPDEKQASYKFLDQSFLKEVEGIRAIKTKTKELLKLYSFLISGNSKSGIPQAFIGEKKVTLFKKVSRFLRGNIFLPDARKGWNKFAISAAKQLLENETFDLVITTGPPHSTHLIGLKLKQLFPIKWMVDFRDPWLELYTNKMLYRTKWAETRDRLMESEVLESADAILTVGPSLKDMLINKLKNNTTKVHFVYSGYDERKFSGLIKNTSKNKFIITHLGLLGQSQPILAFIKAIQQIQLSGNNEFFEKVELHLIGKVEPLFIEQLATQVPFLKCKIIEYLPHQDAIQALLDSDLLFNSMAEIDESKYLISGKLAEYIASGNPILCLGNPEGDANQLFSELKVPAKVFYREDIDAIFNFILEIFVTKVRDKQVYPLNHHSGLSKLEVSKALLEIINKV